MRKGGPREEGREGRDGEKRNVMEERRERERESARRREGEID